MWHFPEAERLELNEKPFVFFVNVAYEPCSQC
jgi:hypothetical protein